MCKRLRMPPSTIQISSSPLTKLKFDRQIIAIARAEGDTTIYSDDQDIAKLATPLALTVIPIHALPLPPQDPQQALDLEHNNKD